MLLHLSLGLDQTHRRCHHPDTVHGNFRYTLVACLLAIAIGIEEYEIYYGSSGREPEVNINTILAGGKTYFDSTILYVVQFK